MSPKDITDEICWRLGAKFLLMSKEITEEQYGEIYNLERLISTETQVDPVIYKKIWGVIESKPKLVAELIKLETDFLLNGNISNEMLWVTYLIECFYDGEIDEVEYEIYRFSIDFDIPRTEKEYYVINRVLEYLRIKTVTNEPTLIDNIHNPSFDVLMAANNVSTIS